MKSVYTIQNFIKMFYLESNIPAYLYANDNLIYTAPKQTALTYPPQKYLENLTNCSEHISYCSTDYGVYYGCVHIDCDSNLILVLGPVNNIPYSDTELHGMYMDYVVPADEQKRFRKFLQNSPQIPLHSLLTKLIFINYCLNEEMLSPIDFLPHDLRSGSGSTKTSTLVEETFQQKEDYFHNKSYELEELVLNYVRTGDLEGLQTVSVNDSDIHAGITGPTTLRQIKNNLIISTTLATRAAIDGGLDYDTAYKLSDDFIQTAEKLNNADDLYALMAKITYTFTEKVKETQTPISSDDAVQKAVRFIQQNTNQPLTVGDVAEYAGFSRSYFSTYFKQELGFSIAAFITRCKLEESRRLLQYTNKSISVISNYLCFSSQSHFQTAFKKQFGVTPLQYRKRAAGRKTKQASSGVSGSLLS